MGLARILLAGVVLGASLGATPLPEDRGAAGAMQKLRRLQTTARVLYLTAHPDDEDGGTITLLTRGRGVQVTLLSISRGESGANLVTADFFDRLGALRTQELLKAAQYYGCDVRFTRGADFGYSKTVEETWRKWDAEEILRDVVYHVRALRPHVILSRFQGTARDGHGHHTAAGVIAQRAFDAAADPARFPEQIAAGLPPWQVSKLYADNFRANEDWTVAVDAGEFDALLGRSYAQIAREGLRWQRSQGAGSAIARPGPAITYYKLMASRVGMADKEQDFLERVNLPFSDALNSLAAEALRHYRSGQEAESARALARGLAEARRLVASGGEPAWKQKERDYTAALAAVLGIELEALVEPEKAPSGPFSAFMPYRTVEVVNPGAKFTVNAVVYQRAARVAEVAAPVLIAPPGWKIEPLGEGRFQVSVPEDAITSEAYWERDSIQDTLYRLTKPAWLGLPLPPPPLLARAEFSVAGVSAAVESEIYTSQVDAIGVQYRQALAVTPPVSVRFATPAGILPIQTQALEVSVILRSFAARPVRGLLRLELPSGWRSEPAQAPFSFAREGEEAQTGFRVFPPPGLPEGEYRLAAAAAADGSFYRHGFLPITYTGLGVTYLKPPARFSVRRVNASVKSGLRVGYVMGTGDDVPVALRQMGVACDLLDTQALAAADLTRYHTIVLGIRAYAARPDLKTYNARLLEYVERGGVLVVQYNTQEYDGNYGPYPYSMTMRAEEVSEEDAPVRILEPGHPVFREPNRISAADFDGWVEQRGSKFFTTWDQRYLPLIETNDRGQPPQRGAWLVARYGKGLYVYCALAWYRQLPFAVPGAARIFANLVSLGAPDASWRTANGGASRPED